ncbi:MAG TPA: hypothetical protein VNE59_03795 [Burkholderiales bacterium]|nr:hypothetical protein [Burkholderiales bacterium]
MSPAQRRCGACRFFTGTPAALERAVPGLNILSSAYGSVRGDTGLCERHDTFVTGAAHACAAFAAEAPNRDAPSRN